MSKVFLYREKESSGRDCCAYIDNNPQRFECGHYFGSVILYGSCYSGKDWPKYEAIETVLTEKEFDALKQFSAAIKKLGYGIEQNSNRYQEGLRLCESIKPVYDKLNSDIADEFYRDIVEDEKKIAMQDYDFTEQQVNEVFANYPLCDSYQDKSIVGAVYSDRTELAEDFCYNMGSFIDESASFLENYIDFEKLGSDLLEEECYHELDDGRCVYYMM